MAKFSIADLDAKIKAGTLRGYTISEIGLNVKEGAQNGGKNATQAKYKNRKIEIDGILFDSTKEGKRYIELIQWQNMGIISELERQVKYLMIDGNKQNRPTHYFADFVYVRDGKKVVEDVKSKQTRKLPVYVMKRKLMFEKHGVIILET